MKWSILVAVVLLAGRVAAEAQQAKKLYRVGYLSSRDAATESERAEAIRLALRERGYVEGKNIIFDYRHADGRLDWLPELAAELVRLNVDLILATAEPPIRAAKNATKTIPIVMVGPGLDPVQGGFVESLARPGGNVTGITNLGPALSGKRLELLKEAVPKLRRVAVLYDPTTPTNEQEVKVELPVAARVLKITLQASEARAVSDFDSVFAALNKRRPDGVFVCASALVNTHQKRIVDFTLKSRLPSVYLTRTAVETGGLMSYGVDLNESHRRVAYYVDRILTGTKPTDLPVEQPMKFELAINLKTAKLLGLTIPPIVLMRATRVIK